jgi:hypothetical protein
VLRLFFAAPRSVLRLVFQKGFAAVSPPAASPYVCTTQQCCWVSLSLSFCLGGE